MSFSLHFYYPACFSLPFDGIVVIEELKLMLDGLILKRDTCADPIAGDDFAPFSAVVISAVATIKAI